MAENQSSRMLLHPVLMEQLHLDGDSISQDNGVITALHVLNYLLQETATISEVDIRSAVTALRLRLQRSDETNVVAKVTLPTATEDSKEETNKCNVNMKAEDTAASSESKPLDNVAPGELPVVMVPTPRPAPPEENRRRHIALRIYYDGGAYSGLAENVGQTTDTSIERALFTALTKAHLVTNRHDTATMYSRCGRTDKGVSAAGQVVALYLKSAFALQATVSNPNDKVRNNESSSQSCIPNEDLPHDSYEKLTVWVPAKKRKGSNNSTDQQQQSWIRKEVTEYAYDKILNNLLPPDIRVLGWTPVTSDFSARFSCTARVYRYFFVPRPSLSMDRMQDALQRMVGKHDFRNFCKMDIEKVYNFVREIHTANIVTIDANTSYILIIGQAFLWHQIRCIAHILFLIGRKLEDPSLITELLDVNKNPGKPSYELAHERPLVLHDCRYNHLCMTYSVSNLWNIVCLQEQQWEDHILAAARIRNCIESLQELTVSSIDLLSFCEAKLRLRERKKTTKQQSTTPSVDLPSSTILSSSMTWKEALTWLGTQGLSPEPCKSMEVVYTPVLERSRGTTYEEKVDSLLQSSSATKRRQKYENNVIKKRKSKEEDAAFYDHKTKQGGYTL